VEWEHVRTKLALVIIIIELDIRTYVIQTEHAFGPESPHFKAVPGVPAIGFEPRSFGQSGASGVEWPSRCELAYNASLVSGCVPAPSYARLISAAPLGVE